MGGCTTSVYPVTLTAPAPTTPGTYTWAVAWYGNQFDASGASFGSGTSPTLRAGFFTPDPDNPNHGFQTVALPSFTVAAPAAPSIALSPPSLTFPTVTLGGTAQQTTQVQNSGTAPLSVTAISRCAGTSSEFSWSPAAPFTVAPGGSTMVTVTYAPLAAGTDTGCLAIASNDPANPSVNLGLSASAVAPTAPGIALDPPSLSFGNVMVGSTGTMTTQVRNTGTATLNVTAIARCSGTSAEFAWSPAAPLTVAPGTSATLTVTYAPTAVGTDTGCLALTSNAATSPTQLQLSGAGTAVPAPSIALAPSSLDFGSVQLGATSTLPVQVQNTGSAPLSVTVISRCAGTSTAYTWSPAAPLTIPAGQATTLMVSYAPVVAGTDAGCLSVASNDPAHPSVDLALSGSGVPQATPTIALVPASLDFGMVTVASSASRTTQVQNAGTAPLHVSAIARCGGTSTAYSWSPAAPLTVAAGGAATLTVTYAPTAAEADNGCLALTSDDPVSPTANLALSGTGVTQPISPVDIDVVELDVPHRLDTSRARTITPALEARNEGNVAGMLPITLVGVRDGAEVYRQSISVTIPVGGEKEVEYPPYAVDPGAVGTIVWTSTVVDADADADVVTAKTILGPGVCESDDGGECEGGDDHHHGGGEGGSGGDTGRPHSGSGLAATTTGPRAAGCSSGGAGDLLSLALLALAALRRRPGA